MLDSLAGQAVDELIAHEPFEGVVCIAFLKLREGCREPWGNRARRLGYRKR